MLTRRQFLAGSLAASSAALWYARRSTPPSPPRWIPSAYCKQPGSNVAIVGADSYDRPLADTIRRGLELFPLDVRGKKVVLKPNLVEFDPGGVIINTHPAIIAGALDAFRTLGAREVVVAEGPGHRRDTEYLLTASGLHSMLSEYDASYVDLNYDNVRPVKTLSRYTGFPHFYFPATVLDADLLVSMPKLKTHHWAGVTLSMKNLFGVIPGAVYGWPKNILHRAGIDRSIVDINSSLTAPRFAILDGIVGMEGNGPIQGTPRHAGFLLFGQDPVAVDATGARLMSVDPWQIPYLKYAGKFLGNLESERIRQIGEPVETYRQDFQVIPTFAHIKRQSA